MPPRVAIYPGWLPIATEWLEWLHRVASTPGLTMGEGDLAEHVDDLICVMDKVVGSQVEITDHYML